MAASLVCLWWLWTAPAAIQPLAYASLGKQADAAQLSEEKHWQPASLMAARGPRLWKRLQVQPVAKRLRLQLSQGWQGDGHLLVMQRGQIVADLVLQSAGPGYRPMNLHFSLLDEQLVTLYLYAPTAVEISADQHRRPPLPDLFLGLLLGLMLAMWLSQQVTSTILADKLPLSHSLTQLPLFAVALMELTGHVPVRPVWLMLLVALLSQQASQSLIRRHGVAQLGLVALLVGVLVIPDWWLDLALPPLLMLLVAWQASWMLDGHHGMPRSFASAELIKLLLLLPLMLTLLPDTRVPPLVALGCALLWSACHGLLLLTLLVSQRRQLQNLLKLNHHRHQLQPAQHPGGLSQQIRSLVKVHRQLEEKSSTDPLTGLKNRGYFDEHYRVELLRSRREQQAFSLLLVDLDHFKQVNDCHGHPCGDKVLMELARVCEQALQRPGDVLCRYGGEEFAVLLPNTPMAGALHVANTLQRAIAAHRVEWSGSALQVTASVGLASVSGREAELPDLLQQADTALYRAKHLGRNRLEVHQPDRPPILSAVESG
ncbi:GGDEF domain-containing protein [Ferrimonas sediminicola]|uniref:diguanylate cyclase n=1 Tax=Ferrimonas sediminicola TaxID=2569538 RepID=A0A4U1BE25_9GAMM|nr:GGDEF domain-containing protein [Ferrimonas sediminicola]TKB49383.1 GGDEF domain-containing protein [Ferrimonas sediminicola]